MKTYYTFFMSAIISLCAFVSCKQNTRSIESAEINSTEYPDITSVDSIYTTESNTTIEEPVLFITDSTAVVTVLDKFRTKNKTFKGPSGICYYTDSLLLSNDSVSVLFTLVESAVPDDSIYFHEYSEAGRKVHIVKKTIKDNKQIVDTITFSRTTLADSLFKMGANEESIKTLFIQEIYNFTIKNDTIIVTTLIMQMDTDVWNDLIEVKLWDEGLSFKNITPPETKSEW